MLTFLYAVPWLFALSFPLTNVLLCIKSCRSLPAMLSISSQRTSGSARLLRVGRCRAHSHTQHTNHTLSHTWTHMDTHGHTLTHVLRFVSTLVYRVYYRLSVKTNDRVNQIHNQDLTLRSGTCINQTTLCGDWPRGLGPEGWRTYNSSPCTLFSHRERKCQQPHAVKAAIKGDQGHEILDGP